MISSLYYMRDNHTFLRLSEDVDAALRQMRETWDEGYTHGMLCTKRKGVSNHVHAGNDWQEFERKAREWYGQLPPGDCSEAPK